MWTFWKAILQRRAKGSRDAGLSPSLLIGQIVIFWGEIGTLDVIRLEISEFRIVGKDQTQFRHFSVQIYVF